MKPSDVKMADYEQGMALLYKSGIFEVLRERGKVGLVGAASSNYTELHVAELNRSFGYNQAIDDLVTFRETFLQAASTAKPLADYGAIKFMVDRGIIDKEKADGLRREFTIATDNS